MRLSFKFPLRWLLSDLDKRRNRFYLSKLAIFRCLIIKATENTNRKKGTTISQDNSGIVGVGVELGKIVVKGFAVGEGLIVGFDVAVGRWVCVGVNVGAWESVGVDVGVGVGKGVGDGPGLE